MKLIHGMGLFAISGLLAACSLNALEDGSVLSIRIDDQSEAPARRVVSPQVSGSPYPAPATISEFDCIGINVSGPGIPDTSNNPEPNQPALFGKLLRKESYCSYRGILGGPVSATATTPQELSMVVPSGSTRLVQLVGFKHRNGSNDCQVEFTPGMQPPIVNGQRAEGDVYEVGRAVVDLFSDRLVSITPEWNGLSGAERENRVVDCGNNSPNPQSSFGIGSFLPVGGVATPRAVSAIAYDARGGTPRLHVVGGDVAGTSQSILLSGMTWSGFTSTGLPSVGGSVVVPKASGTTHLNLLGGVDVNERGRYRSYDGTIWTGPSPIPSAGPGDDRYAGYSAPLVDAGATYIFGSWGSAATHSDRIWKYTHATDTFSSVGNLPELKHSVATAVVAPGNLLAVGGLTGGGVSSNTCTRVIAGTVSSCANYPVTIHGLALVGIPGNKALAVGGRTSQTSITQLSVYLYDGTSNTWTAKTSLPVTRQDARAFLINGGTQVLVLGGQTSDTLASITTATFIYDIANDAWVAGPPMLTPRSSFAATQALDGRIVVVGGLDGGGAPISSAEFWQP